jgi:DNA-directed RNA polymerase specialized sigma24 family protein
MDPTAHSARPPDDDISDRTLVERMANGDATAVCELLARYRSTMYATAYATLVDPERAEAAVATTFEDARRTAPSFLKNRGSVSAWLTYLAGLNVAMQQHPA